MSNQADSLFLKEQNYHQRGESIMAQGILPFKYESDWKPIYKVVKGKKEDSGVQWAEVCFVPNAIGHSKKGPEYRYLAKREVIVEQRQFPGMEQQLSLPFPTIQLKGKKYKVYGIVTNMDWDGEELIDWYHKRCGKSEQAHNDHLPDLNFLQTHNVVSNGIH